MEHFDLAISVKREMQLSVHSLHWVIEKICWLQFVKYLATWKFWKINANVLNCVLSYVYNCYVVSLWLHLSIQDALTESSKRNPLFSKYLFYKQIDKDFAVKDFALYRL